MARYARREILSSLIIHKSIIANYTYSVILKQLIMCHEEVSTIVIRHDRGKLEQSCGARIDPRPAVRYLGKRSALD